MSRAILLKRPNPLAYPGIAPGYDPSHIANIGGKTRLSTIATPKTGAAATDHAIHYNILSGKKPSTILMANTSDPITRIGPATRFSGGTEVQIFGGNAAITPAAITTAAIVIPQIDSAGACIATNSNGATQGMSIFWNAGGVYAVRLGATSYTTTTITLLLNVPYFLAISATPSGTLNFLARRLDTGQVLTEVQTPGAENFATDGNYVVGNWAGQSFAFQGAVAATFYAEHFMTMTALRQWAQDPWSQWYPDKFDMLTMLKGSPVVVVPAGGSTMAMMGIG